MLAFQPSAARPAAPRPTRCPCIVPVLTALDLGRLEIDRVVVPGLAPEVTNAMLARDDLDRRRRRRTLAPGAPVARGCGPPPRDGTCSVVGSEQRCRLATELATPYSNHLAVRSC